MRSGSQETKKSWHVTTMAHATTMTLRQITLPHPIVLPIALILLAARVVAHHHIYLLHPPCGYRSEAEFNFGDPATDDAAAAKYQLDVVNNMGAVIVPPFNTTNATLISVCVQTLTLLVPNFTYYQHMPAYQENLDIGHALCALSSNSPYNLHVGLRLMAQFLGLGVGFGAIRIPYQSNLFKKCLPHHFEPHRHLWKGAVVITALFFLLTYLVPTLKDYDNYGIAFGYGTLNAMICWLLPLGQILICPSKDQNQPLLSTPPPGAGDYAHNDNSGDNLQEVDLSVSGGDGDGDGDGDDHVTSSSLQTAAI